ncbi:hypothetical protein OCEANICA350_10223 [Oceanicaulis sp. 350]|nr:hypothetical protein OCEANICA350_10223 [Oceanicaulis sp. 350]
MVGRQELSRILEAETDTDYGVDQDWPCICRLSVALTKKGRAEARPSFQAGQALVI